MAVYIQPVRAAVELLDRLSNVRGCTSPLPLAIPVVSGIGKTTLIHKASEALKSSGTPIDGFYTEEVRQEGKRIGFDVVTLSGKHGILARIGTGQSDGKREYRVGQYVVDISSFEDFVLPTLDCMLKNGNSAQKSVCVIDEIGKMELFSQKFIFVVHKIFASSNAVVFGTIPVPKGKPLPLVEEIRHRQDVKVLNITKENRDTMLQEIVTTIRNCI